MAVIPRVSSAMLSVYVLLVMVVAVAVMLMCAMTFISWLTPVVGIEVTGVDVVVGVGERGSASPVAPDAVQQPSRSTCLATLNA